MVGMSDMLKTARTEGWIKGFKVNTSKDNNIGISHLHYADDASFCSLL